MGYSQQMGRMHPPGMLSCLSNGFTKSDCCNNRKQKRHSVMMHTTHLPTVCTAVAEPQDVSTSGDRHRMSLVGTAAPLEGTLQGRGLYMLRSNSSLVMVI